ncbi:hypothetical protein PHJA_001354700 [Phtheirospermum japonicum]|uniref:Uncharacterized protein n=1 Tax=Phtheirospermum japonicum TaxID=374723 RepID=A0A830BZ66_9LAMI|nr:hypothetical protein PHJA_001354700 [Phtheirospermum japonicum]
MLPRRRPTTLRTCVVFARRSLPAVPSSQLAVWAGCPSLMRSVRLWITGTNVVEWNSRQVYVVWNYWFMFLSACC